MFYFVHDIIMYMIGNSFVHIPPQQLEMEKHIYQSLKKLYSKSRECTEHEVVFKDNSTLTLLPFTYPDVNMIVTTTQRHSRHDYIKKGTYENENFKILYRYDQMGAVTKIVKV